VRATRVALVVALASLFAACGGGGSNSTAATPTPSLNGEQTKSPAQILSDARTALTAVGSLSIDAAYTDSRGNISFRIDIDLAGKRAHMVGTEGGGQFEVLVVGGKVYLVADAAFYAATNQASLGDLVAGQWVIPPQSSGLVTGLLALVDRTNAADCILGQTHGALTLGGTGQAQGTIVATIVDAGDVAGSAPQTISVSLVGTPYPLQVKQSGAPQKTASGKAPSCSLANSTTTSGQATLHNFGISVVATPPANPIDLTLLGGGGPAPASPTP
jgi:hypothetical protein